MALPVIAAGGITTPADTATALRAGAHAVMVGTALLRTHESGASAPHKAALDDPAFTDTPVTRAFTGRPARALRNRFTDALTDSIQRAPGTSGQIPPGPVVWRTRGTYGLQGIITQWFSMTRPPRSRPPQTASLGYALISRLTTNRHRETFALLPR